MAISVIGRFPASAGRRRQAAGTQRFGNLENWAIDRAGTMTANAIAVNRLIPISLAGLAGLAGFEAVDDPPNPCVCCESCEAFLTF